MNNLDKQYTELLQDILDNGVVKGDRTGTGTISVFGRTIRHKMSEGFPLLTTKKMAWKPIVTELCWFLRGDTNISWLVRNGCNIWNGDAYKKYQGSQLKCKNATPTLSMKEFVEAIKTDEEFAKEHGDLGPIYGKQWRNWDIPITKEYALKEGNENLIGRHIDQIANLIHGLKNNPDSRRLMVNAWNVGEIENMTLPPCHYGFQCYTRELSFEERRNLFKKEIHFNILSHGDLDVLNAPKRTISLQWTQRSVDTFLGLPFNIASYGLLLEIIAKEVNMIPDELIGQLGDTHLYTNHVEQARIQIGSELSDSEIDKMLRELDNDTVEIYVTAKRLKAEAIKEQRYEVASTHRDIERDAREKLANLPLPLINREPYPLPSIKLEDIVPWKEGDCLPHYNSGHIELVDYKSHPTIKAKLSN